MAGRTGEQREEQLMAPEERPSLAAREGPPEVERAATPGIATLFATHGPHGCEPCDGTVSTLGWSADDALSSRCSLH